MSHQDNKDVAISLQTLKEVFDWLLPDCAKVPRHGNAKISSFVLAATAIACWGCSTQRTLTQRVREAASAVQALFHQPTAHTRQGVCDGLANCGEQLAAEVKKHICSRLRQLKGHWTTAGRPTYAVDGSKFAAPRTAPNQDAFAVLSAQGKSRGKKKKSKRYRNAADAAKAMTVQVLATVFWHIGSGLPVTWRLSASSGSERQNAAEMLDELPPNARVVGDAEYVGYPFWSTVMNSGRSFVVRVGSNVTLLKKLGVERRKDVVYHWPESVQRNGQPPLMLRLIQVKTARSPMWLLTNEFDLTEQQIREIYCSRWGIEVFFRTVKHNCRRAKLQCRTPRHVRTELTWTLLGIWASLFVAKMALMQERQPIERLSPIRVLDMFGRAILLAALDKSGHALQLHTCVKQDETNRTSSKKSRDYPRKKRHKSCGAPKIKIATQQQIHIAKQLL